MKKLTLYLLLFALLFSMTACFARPLPEAYESFSNPCQRASVAASEFEKGMAYADAKELLHDLDATYFWSRKIFFKDKYGVSVFLYFDFVEASSATNTLTLSKVTTYAEPWTKPFADELRIEEGKTTLEDVVAVCGMPYVGDKVSCPTRANCVFPLRGDMHLSILIDSDFIVSAYRIFTTEELVALASD